MIGLLAAALTSLERVVAQQQPATTIVSSELEPRRFVEPHLVLHPAKANHWLAAVWTGSTSESDAQERRCSSLVSTDNGATWKRHDFAIEECYDAQVAIVPDGQAVFVALARVRNIRPDRPDWLVVFHSPDGGLTWSDIPTVIGTRHDHPTVAVDLSTSSRRGWIYISSHLEWADGSPERKSAIFVTRSRDSGQSFDVPVMVSPSNSHNSTEMAVVLSDGTLVVSFQEFAWQGITARRKLWVMRSKDGGVTFAAPRLVNEQCGPPPGFQLTSMAADPLSAWLYVACRRAEGGPIVVHSSGDQGDSWSPGAAVADPPSMDAFRRQVSIAVSTTGVVGSMIVERLDNSTDRCLNVGLSVSRDRAQTFTTPLTLSSLPCGDSPNDQRARRRFPTYGDYYGIAATRNEAFRLMWPEMRAGRSVLVTTVVSVR